MDKEQAYKIGLAFKLGMIYARGRAHAQLTNDSKLALDDPKWITVHPNGTQTDRSAIEAENANLNKQIKDLNKKIKATSKYSPDFEALKQQKQALEEQRKINANLLGAEKQRQQANEHNQKIRQQQTEREAQAKASSEKRLQETIEKQARAKEEFKNKRLTEIANIKKPSDQQFLYAPIVDFKETASGYQVINPTYAVAVEKLGAKEARGYNKYISIPKESATVIDGKIQAVTEEYRNKLKRASINNAPLSITNTDFKKYHMPLNQLAKIEKENGFKTQRSRELAKRLRLPQNNTTTANKTLSANKDNGSVASVLNVPDASKWNNKIYNYRNGEKAVFINNQKIVLNAEQYKKLKELAGK